MTKQNLLKRIYLLRKKAELNKLVVFVGAGVSCNVEGMPSWSELIAEMAKTIDYSKCNSCKHSKECKKRCDKCAIKDKCTKQCLLATDFSSDEFLRIPQYVYNKNKKTYDEIIQRCISDKAVDAPLSKAIFEVNPAHIITTNYDKLLESSSSEFRNQYDVIITDKNLLESEKSKYIIKMHGDVLFPDTIVLKEQDYLDYSQNHVLIELFVKALLADHTILFLGYSLNDYNIKLIISWINYLRAQNGVLPKGKNIGYIILDEDKVNSNTSKYFKNNSIEVINIKPLPQIKDIPSDLTSDRGKRLYSFLRILTDPSLEDGISSEMSIDGAIDFIGKHKIHDYKVLLKLLNVKSCSKNGSVLDFHKKDQYLRLESYFKTNTDKAELLKQLFVNVGLATIRYHYFDNDITKTHNLLYSIDTKVPNALFDDEFFNLYIQNKYLDLLELCRDNASDIIKSGFYKHFAIGYLESTEDYERIDFETLDMDSKVSFLHNSAVIDAIYHYRFDSNRVQQFINNIPSTRERQLFEDYLNIHNGNTSKRLDMLMSLEKLKHNIASISTTVFSGGAIAEIYKIKNIAITEYIFYYTNNIFTLGFNDLTLFLRPYIEAIIYANKEAAEKSWSLMGFEAVNEKYSVSAIDFDIISKYISTKDLAHLIDENKIVQFRTDRVVVSHLVSCFANTVYSMVNAQTYGYNDSSITVTANLALLLTKLDLNNEDKEQISIAVSILFSDDEFNKRFWNVGGVAYHGCLNAFSQLIKMLPINGSSINCIHSIIHSPGFFEFSINSSVYDIRTILLFFLNEEESESFQTEIINILDAESDFNKKVMLLRLFYKRIVDKETQEEFKLFLSDNFSKIGVQAIYDFALNTWIKPSKQHIDELKQKTLKEYRSRKDGVGVFPDPVKTNLDCLYLLHIFGLADDLNSLEELCSENPHLRFLLHPETFDYSLVDFSNYMWGNFAHQPKYMDLFVRHRDVIIKSIKEKMTKDMATDIEKKILYGFLLNGEEIWQ